MKPISKKHKVGQLHARLNDFVKPRAYYDQKDFAELIGCSRDTVVSLEATKWVRAAKGRKRDGGPRLRLSPSLAYRIARATGVSLPWLLDNDRDAPIVNYAGRPYTKEDFKRATKHFGKRKFLRNYVGRVHAQIEEIMSSAIEKGLAAEAVMKIERCRAQGCCEFGWDFELRERRMLEQASGLATGRRS